MILLSIIIPIYNVETYLVECLESVFSQDLANCEVICVNDGSTDNSYNVLQEYKTKFSGLIIIDRPNRGLSAARNAGTKRAVGEYIYYLDSDDFLLEGAIKEVKEKINLFNDVDILQFNSNIDTDITYFATNYRTAQVLKGKEFFTGFYNYNNKFLPSPVWMYVYKSSFLHKNGLIFKEGLLHEDEHFTPMAFFAALKVVGLYTPILFHRTIREGAITFKVKTQNLIDRIQVGVDLYNFFFTNKCIETTFYHKSFELFISAAKHLAVVKKKDIRKIFNNNFYHYMKKSAKSYKNYLLYILFRYNKKVFKKYLEQSYPKFFISFINKIIKVHFKYILKNGNSFS